MTTVQLVELLRAADTAWTTAEGVTRHWRRQDLVSRAFDRKFEEARGGSRESATLRLSRYEGVIGWLTRASTVRTEAESPGTSDDGVLETVLAVAADRPGRQRRAQLLVARGDEVRADLLVVDGDTFWARTGDQLVTNGGNPNSRHGGADIVDELLCPGYVPANFTLTAHGLTHLAGRTCVEATARLRTDLSEDERWDLPEGWFGMISGGGDFRLAFDASTGVIVRASKYVDGQLAEVTEWQELRLDPALPPSLFSPLE